jgi:HlyD family secretion protein
MKGTWVWISLLAVGAGAGGAAWSMRHRKAAAIPPSQSGALVLPDRSEVTVSGVIRPQHITAVTSTVSGNVETVMASVGDDVYQGQVLARIGAAGLESEREAAAHAVEYAQEQVAKAESAIASARLEASRASADQQRSQMALDRAEKVYSRQKTLHAAGATPRLTYEKAEQDYESQQQESAVMEKAVRAATESVQSAFDQLASAKKVLADKTEQLEAAQGAFEAAEVRAPVDGLVVERKAEAGKSVQEVGGDLFQLATDVFALEVAVEPQADVLKRLRPAQPALVLIPDLQAASIPGSVKAIQDTQAIVEFTSTLAAIRPGMRADVRFKLE